MALGRLVRSGPVPRESRPNGGRVKAQLLAVSGATIVLAIGAVAVPAQASETGAPSRSDSHAPTARAHTAVVQLPARWSAGPVALWSGYGQGGSQRVRQVQRALRELHYRPGSVDGLFGPLTQRAVLRFQRTEALQPDGIVGPRTLDRMRARLGQPRTIATPPTGAARSPERHTVRPMPQGRTAPAPRDLSAGHASPGWDSQAALLLVLCALAGLLLFIDPPASRRHGPRPVRQVPPSDAVVPSIGPVAPAAPVPSGDWADGNGGAGPRLGEVLRDAGELSAPDLVAALREQARSGGRLGEILVASGTVPMAELAAALGHQLGVDTLRSSDEPVALLTADDAQTWRAVALSGSANGHGAVAVAIADPTDEVLAKLEARLGRPVHPRLCDEETLDELLNRVYADADADDVIRALRETAPELSAFRTRLSLTQALAGCVLGFLLVVGLVTDLLLTATVLVALATAFFVASTGFRLWAARQGFRPGATIDPPPAELAAVDERALPIYTVLLPLYKEKAGTVRALFEALSRMDYPKHKLDALLLIEADDDQTRAAIEQVGRPAWMRVLPLPPGTPRTKPRAMGIGLRYAKGTLVAVYDAEDKPDPAQLKKAAWGFERVDSSVACLQAKLGYYNPRQNLLTRWFTLEYDAWFNIFLPGLHRIGAPIPLGGTSNHFRREALEECLGWDPYNVTEDADLGLRFARLGLTTTMLESTTGEEANSQVPNWLRQRSRWSKGYMQTVLVHTRRPWTLLRDLGPKATAGFLLTLGGTFVTSLLAPVFWVLLLLWCFFQPDWIAALFPGPIYYAASICLVAGNFALVFLSLGAAVGRGHDDLAPYALLTPCYWVLMSAATYLALFELFFRPYHWHKTEHGLHLAEEAA
jgi:cellulose synthase/poly-beta-1,6-N-acetylglucosamine synthase-like glycosyltransferase/peptidoglycan hydrolase-like protein with peptidoglycan-binding domain